MRTNKVAPWEGALEWVGDPRTGTSKKGRTWSSVDFVLKYTDDQDNERHIMFSAFGSDKVDTILSAKVGTTVRVQWRPDAHEYNGRWFCKFDAFDVTIVGAEKEEPKQTEMPKDAPLFKEQDDPAPATNEQEEDIQF